MKVGETIEARALDCDGGKLVRGVLLDKRGPIVLLDMPHGRWCFAEGARVLHGAAETSSAKISARPKRRKGKA